METAVAQVASGRLVVAAVFAVWPREASAEPERESFNLPDARAASIS